MNLKRNLKKGLAVVFSALMMTSGMNIPVVAEDTVTDEPSQMHIVYGFGEGKVTVTQNGETTELTSDASGEQKVYTVQGNENEPVEITVEAGTDFNVERFSEYIYGAEADEITSHVSEPTKTVAHTVNISMGKIVEIAFTDPALMNEVMTLGAPCAMGAYQSHGFAGLADFAMTQLYTPYATGGTGFGSYDCCGLVSRAFWAIGWTGYENPPGFHNTIGWHNILQAVGFHYSDIDLSQGFNPAAYPTQRGDIAIFYDENGIAGPNSVHAAIMLDNNNMIGALYQGVTNQIPVSNWYTQSGLGAKDSRYVRIYHLSYQPEIPTTVTVTKTSTKADVTNGNSLYSMEGAEYTIYRDQACTQALTTVTIGADGKGTSGEFTLDTPNATTLYAKETKAPSNGSYKLNETPIAFTVQNGSGSFTASDEPINDPLMIQISKLSEDNEIIDNPSSLEGAEFTVKYYAGEYDSLEELTDYVEPTKTWILGTKKVGNIYLAALSDEYKVGGDDFYYNEYNTPVLYLGTLTIEETKAPAGYTKEGALSFKVNNETQEAELVDGVALFKLMNENSQVSFKTANGLSIDNAELRKEEANIRGGLEVYKYDAESESGTQGGNSSGLTATFTIHNDNAYDVVMRGANDEVLGTAEAGQDFTYTITTNADGYWKSSGNFLPVGKYTIRETVAPEGYNLDAQPYQFEITAGNTSVVIQDHFKDTVIRGGFEIQKKDTETGTRPQGDTNLQISFNVVSNNTNPVIVNGQTYNNGDVVLSGVTDEIGYYKSAADLLPYGSYTLTETNAPVGYTDNGNTSVDFTISENGVVLDLTNEINNDVALGGINLHKVFTDVEGTNWTENEPGAVFGVVRNTYVEQYGSVAEAIAHQYGVTTAEVTNRDWLNENLFANSDTADTLNKDGSNADLMTGHEYAVIRTNADGDATTGDKALAYGDYTVAQLASGDDEITVTDQKYNVTINGDGTMLQLQASNIPQTYFIRMVKKDADTGELSTFNSAEFKIFQLEDVRGEEVNEYVTMKVGSVTYDTFRTTSDNGSSDLPSGTFYAVGESAGTVTTPLKLESGLYRIEEVGTPDGFVTTDPIEQVVRLANISETDDEGNNFITVTISNPRAYGELVINKSIVDTAADTDLIPADVLSKIEFTLTAAEDIINPDDGTVLTKKGEVAKDILGNTVGQFNLNAEGQAAVSKIALGKYVLTESFIPDELAVNTETWDVVFEQTEGDVTTKVYNVTLDIENKPTYIELSKKAVTGDEELPGAHIQIIEKSTGTVVDEYTSTEKPHSIKGLKRNATYIMRETMTPNNGEYVKATDIEFTVNADGSVKTVTMIDKLVSLKKSDVNGNLVAGAEITVTDKNGNPVNVITTDGENTFHIYNLTAGEEYNVSETVVPEGYVKFNDFTFTVLDDGKDQTLEIVNKKVTATKLNTKGEPISGAEMNVTDVNGNIIDNWTTNGTDHDINGLVEDNDYVLNEVKAANGYVIATSIPFTVTGADDQNIKVNQNVTMTDKTVEIQKVDMCGVNVDGAQLTIYELDADGNVITETVMDEAGNPVEQPKVVDQWTTVLGMHHYANNLTAGHTYKVVETFVPEGYAKAPDYVFTVADDGKDQTETIVNKQVLISKETVGGEPVEGAILTIIDKETGEVVDRFVTEKTMHESNNLVEGKTYILHEDTTPAGFVTATDVEFTVTEDGIDQTVTMVDAVEEVAKVDQNGDLLKGASLELVDEQGAVIDSWISGRHVIDLTEEQIADLESGKFVETVMEDGRTAEIIVTDKNAVTTPEETPEETEDPEGGDNSEDVCEIKYAEPAEELTAIEVTEDSDLAFTLVITNEDGSKEYINIDLNGDETTHRLSNTVAGTEYTLREVDEVNGYYFAENQTVNVTGTENHTTTMIDNIINYRINKVDEDGNNIAGVLMSLQDITDPENPVDVELPNGGVTTEEGFDLSGILIAGHRYEITEERTVEGFSMPQVSTMEFVVPTHGSAEWTVLNFENLSNAIAVSKVDNAGKPLAGAKMQIIEATVAEDGTITEGNVVYEFTTTDTPTDISDYVKGGDGTQYILREIESPFGYEVINDMLFTVDMAQPGTAQLLTAVDSLEHVFIKAVKVDAADHNKVLEGAELTLYTADGEIAKTVDGRDAVAVTDENGEIYWEVEYAEGMYVQETKAPEGYKLNSNFHEVKIGEDYTFVENEPIEIMVADEANPKTGISSGIGGMIAMAGMAGALGVLLYSMRKKEKTSEAE